MGHSHHHHNADYNEKNKTKLLLTMILNFIITIAEVIGSIVSGSLSLMSDALHNFSDGISSIISFIAIKLLKIEHSEKHTFGFKRATMLAAFLNSLVLLVISIFLIERGIEKLIHPVLVNGMIVSLVALTGLVANVLSTLILRKSSKDDLNMKAAYLHLLSDALSSIAVIIGGIFIYVFKWYWLDPVLTLLISVYILKEAFEIIKQSIHVIMQGTPFDVNVKAVQNEVESLKMVNNVHHMHLWGLNENTLLIEMHIDLVTDLLLSKTEKISREIKEILYHKFNIRHVTLQFEYNSCCDKKLIKNVL